MERKRPRREVTMLFQVPEQRVDIDPVKVVNCLGIKLYKKLAEDNINVLLSPLSISTALDMLVCGSESKTTEKLINFLGYKVEHIKHEEIKLRFQKLLDALDSIKAFHNLHFFNAVLIERGFPLKEEYISLLKVSFKALYMEADFIRENDETVESINEWVKTKTNHAIPEFLESLFPFTPNNIKVLNAAYFKGSWLNPFYEERTYPQSFCNKGYKEEYKKVDMMHGIGAFRYMEKKSYQVLQLPNKRCAIFMLILLPNSADGLRALEDSLSSSFIQEIEQQMELVIIEVAMPKFKLEHSIQVDETFLSMGDEVRPLFRGQKPNLCNNTNKYCNIHMKHTAILEINEQGDDTLATSQLRIKGIRRKTKQFLVNHPFMFVIYNGANNLILFMGRIRELE